MTSDPPLLSSPGLPGSSWASLGPNIMIFDPDIKIFDPNIKIFELNIKIFDPNIKIFDPKMTIFDAEIKIFDPNIKIFDSKNLYINKLPINRTRGRYVRIVRRSLLGSSEGHY